MIIKLFHLTTLLLLPLIGFGQPPLAQKTRLRYDGNEATWITEQRENWKYNPSNRETEYRYWHHYQGPYAPTNNQWKKTTYREDGQIEFVWNRSWGDTIWTLTESRYDYNQNKELAAIHLIRESSGQNFIWYERQDYSKGDNNHHIFEQYQSAGDSLNLVKEYRRDSFFDEHDNLVKQTIINYDDWGNFYNERWWTNTYDDEQRLTQTGTWFINPLADTMYMRSRHTFTYEDGGNTQIDFYEERFQLTDNWQSKHRVQRTVDEAGREIFYLYEQFKSDVIDTTMIISTYTSEGLLETQKEYKSNYSHWGFPLRLIRTDSMVYHYDEDNLLVMEDRYVTYINGGRIAHTNIRYEYYCNGLLKAEIIENLPSVRRIEYEYHGTDNCIEEGAAPLELSVYPNPAKGYLTLKSDLFGTPNTVVELYSIDGRLIKSDRVYRIAGQYRFELPALAAGNYVVHLSSDMGSFSRVVVVD